MLKFECFKHIKKQFPETDLRFRLNELPHHDILLECAKIGVVTEQRQFNFLDILVAPSFSCHSATNTDRMKE